MTETTTVRLTAAGVEICVEIVRQTGETAPGPGLATVQVRPVADAPPAPVIPLRRAA